MSGFSKTIIVGRVGKDPELKHLQSGSAVCNLSVATSESWTDKKTGEKTERTEWHRVVLWNQQAEFAGQYVTKGALVVIEGQNETRSWEDKEGKKMYTTEIKGRSIQLLSKADGAAKPASKPAEAPKQEGFADEDIPFN